jgi:hypothetical protein
MERPLFLYTWDNALVMFTEASLLFVYRSMVDEIKLPSTFTKDTDKVISVGISPSTFT